MKTKILYLFILLLSATGIFAQDREIKQTTAFNSADEAAKTAKEILKASGYKANFLVAEAQVQNAVAVLHQGKRYILYNPKFMDALTRITGTKWAAISVLAHEIGHHVYGKTVNGKQTLATELKADEFSGYVLEKMGATLAEAQVAMKFLATNRASATHPAKADRISSIAKGYEDAGGVIPETTEETIAVVESRPPTQPNAVLTASVRFNANPSNEYYVTNKMNLIRVTDSKLSVIGRVTKSSDDEYPYIIYDDTGYRLYVERTGAIVTSRGKVVGRMSAYRD